jgi:hypothetical protein
MSCGGAGPDLSGVDPSRQSESCESEVEDFHLAGGRDFDVQRLQIAVNNPLFVGSLERIRNLPDDGERFIGCESAPSNPDRDRFAFDEFENESRGFRCLFQPIDRADIRVVERGEYLGLPSKSGEALGVSGELGRQFERNHAAQFGVASPIDRSHAAGAKHSLDFVRPEHGAG